MQLLQPKLEQKKMLANEHCEGEMESDITEEIIKVETDEIVLNEVTSQFITSAEFNQMLKTNQNKTLEKQIHIQKLKTKQIPVI